MADQHSWFVFAAYIHHAVVGVQNINCFSLTIVEQPYYIQTKMFRKMTIHGHLITVDSEMFART